MKKIKNLFCLIVPFILDRITKSWVLKNSVNNLNFKNFIFFDFTINRGISWGIFHSDNCTIFWFITLIIILLITFLCYYTILRFKEGHKVFAELIVISGALSNLVDRLIYGGVIDFILISYKNWSFPVFNIADIFITLGVLIILINNIKISYEN